MSSLMESLNRAALNNGSLPYLDAQRVSSALSIPENPFNHQEHILDLGDATNLSHAPSSGEVASSEPNLDLIQKDPQSQEITDAANGEENQDFFGGLTSSIGEMQKQQMAYNERMSKMIMDYQTEMSNTAYQRAMADMKAAGLNPILAYSQGGASTPSVTPSSYSLGGGDTLTDFVNMITSGASNILKAIASLLPSGQAANLLKAVTHVDSAGNYSYNYYSYN